MWDDFRSFIFTGNEWTWTAEGRFTINENGERWDFEQHIIKTRMATMMKEEREEKSDVYWKIGKARSNRYSLKIKLWILKMIQ